MTKDTRTTADKAATLTGLIEELRMHGYQIEWAMPSFPNWLELADGLLELAQSVGCNDDFGFVMRFSPSGRLRLEKTFEEAYAMLIGMLTICSENSGLEPFISSHDGMVVVR